MSVKNNQELGILREFQDRIIDLEMDEANCLRFLIAREFNIDRAEEMIRRSVKWRTDVNVDFLSREWQIPSYLKNDFKYEFTGQSHNGGPVVWVPGGLWNIRYWVEQRKTQEIMKFVFKILEECLVRMQELGNKQIVALYDFEGLTYYKVASFQASKVLYQAFQTLEQNYPEILEKVIIFNAPYTFYLAWNVLQPCLSTRTLDKFIVYGNEKKKFLPGIKAVCPDSAIPKQYLDN